MDSTTTMFNATELGVKLSPDGDGIIARPASRLTPELREAIRQNKTTLLKDLLLRDALAHLTGHYVEGTDLSVLDDYDEEIAKSYDGGTLEEFRSLMREYVKCGRREFARRESLNRASPA